MRVKIDENLASAHRRVLEQGGHDVADVHEESLAGATDEVLWSHVFAEKGFFVTWIPISRTSVAFHLGRTRESSFYGRHIPVSQWFPTSCAA